MNKNRQRKLAARANRRASLQTKYGTSEIHQEPELEEEIKKEVIVAVTPKMPEVVVKRGRGRPPKPVSTIMDKKQPSKNVLSQKAGSKKKEKKHGR